MKDFNINHHHNTLHKAKCEKFIEASRAAFIANHNLKLHKQQPPFTRTPTKQQYGVLWRYTSAPSIIQVAHPQSKLIYISQPKTKSYSIFNR